ncbi:MAG: tetratricopeptide repeat protein, partial [Acidobacteriota bacterium]
ALERYIQQGGYDLVHYDGHGAEGLLWFEDQMVEASRLGQILARSGVPLFVLNACRSAVDQEESQAEPGQINSVAHGLLSTGAWGVLAMSANVRVTSTVAYFDRFYAELAAGASLARAAHRARRSLETALHVGPMDWAIPVLYLRRDFTPFQPDSAPSQEVLQILKGESSVLEPAGPSDIFIGRDGDLFKVDRALDEYSRVLVYGVGGIGKTTLMEHMLQWRRRTGGADRVFSFSFRAAPTLEALAIQLQEAVIEVHPKIRSHVQAPEWADLPTQDKLARMGQVMAADEQRRWLLLFDNLETLGGYPAPGDGPYSDEDRQAFLSLLAALEGGSCPVVMTARRDEAGWLTGHTRRLPVTGVKPHYRLEMLRAYAEEFGADARLRSSMKGEGPELEDLLRELGGHPLATRVAAYGLKDRSLNEVLESIRGQAARIEVPSAEKGTRSESLEAVIAGALSHIPPDRRRALGLVGLFRGRFHQNDFFQMLEGEGFPKEVLPDRSKSFVEGVLREGSQLGLMAPDPELAGMWETVPGAQAALEPLWRQGLSPEQVQAVEQQFLSYWAAQSRLYSAAFSSQGQAQQVVTFLLYEEGNLRRALDLAAAREDWEAAFPLLNLLLVILPRLGRTKDADHLRTLWLESVSQAGQPRDPSDEGQVDLWRFLMGNLAIRAQQAGDLEQAEEIYGRIVQALESLTSPSQLDQRNLAVGYHLLGMVEQQRGQLDEAEGWYRKSLQINEELGDRPGLARSFHQLGIVEQKRGRLDEAEGWYRKSLQILEELGDRPGLAGSSHQLGRVEEQKGNMDRALELFLASLEIYSQLGLKEGAIAVGSIRRLDRTLGREAFLALWEQNTGSRELPEGLLEDEETATEEKPSSSVSEE